MSRLQKAAQNGAQVLIVRYSNGDHGDSDEISAALGTYNLSNLKLVSNGNYDNVYHYNKQTNYSFQWIDEQGKIHNFETVEEAQQYMSNALTGISKTLYERCDTLADFSSQFQGSGDTLSSNLSLVSNSMNELKSNITEHQDLNYVKESDNEAGIVGAMYNVTNYYGTVTNLLYGNLSAEADAVYEIANAIYQMDGFASVMADSTLSDGMKSLYDPSNPSLSAQIDNLNKASSNLLDTARSAIMAGGRYDELSSILGKNIQAGNVGKISIGSLESAINSIVPALGAEVDKAKTLSSNVSDFMSSIGASNVLQGQVWENVKTNMANYQNLLDANVKASDFIENTILTAMGMITDYIQSAGDKVSAVGALADYGGLATSLDELDDSKLPELTSALAEMQAKIDETDAKVKRMEAARHMVADGYTDPETGEFVKTGEHQEPSEEEIQVFRDQLANYIEIKATLDSYREVLEGFAPVVQAAQNIINDAVAQVKAMYENPVQNTDGNITFNSDFNLDLSPYSNYIDVSKDYKGLINDYHNRLNSPIDETLADTQVSTQPVGAGSPPSSGGQGSGPASAPYNDPYQDRKQEQPQRTPGPNTEKPTVPPTSPREQKPEVKTQAPQENITVPNEEELPSQDDEIIDEPVDTEPRSALNLPYGPYFDEESKPKIINLDAQLENEAAIESTSNDITIEPSVGNEYIEKTIEEPKIVSLSSSNSTPSVEAMQKPKSLKTMGIASALGVAMGASAMGAYKIMNNKDEEEPENYGYNK